jgi:cell division protein FtsW
MGLLLIVGKQIKVDQQRKKQQQKVDIRRQFNYAGLL